LIEVSEDKLLKELPIKIAKAIVSVRNGKVNILPGFDGEYGEIEILKEKT
jgi:PHP family Zn ribbon phosphoesterase